ncbi:MAG: hypothetical protein EOO77_39810 [Oxalobacteraceae bacterium]|nr:MAG: hypothetical protein EOO77_39810 [Oxalobacteraceae bacterium]
MSWTGTEFNLQIERFFALTSSGRGEATHDKQTVGNGMVMGAMRYALCGGQSGAGVKQVMTILGRANTLARLDAARRHLEESD